MVRRMLASSAGLVAAALLAGSTLLAGPPVNLLKNGSFEGCTKYWIVHGAVDKEKPAFGQYCLRVDEKGLRSASFPLPLGRSYRISLSARASKAGQVKVCIAPGERPTAQKHQYAWNFRYKMKVGPAWRRASFAFTPENVTTGAMPESTWILMVVGPHPFWLDGLCVTRSGGEKDYVPHSPVEVVAEAPGLPPYTRTGRLLSVGDQVAVCAHIHNYTDLPRTMGLAWGALDYAGSGDIGPGVEVTVPPGETATERHIVTLSRRGLTLARAIVDGDGEVHGLPHEISYRDSSDVPLTAVPFPDQATKPDPRERFGGSFRGPLTTRLAQRMGLRWCRWWWGPMGWKAVQPDGPDDWTWESQDERIALLEKHGMAINYVMYSPPKWAAAANHLPKDMQWGKDDARWDDLKVQTSWDAFVTKLLTRYKSKAIAWEFANEPEIRKPPWDPALYFRIVERTSRRIRQIDPKATFLINATWPGVTGLNQQFFKRGGAKLIDAYSWHNYSPGPAASADAMTDIKRWLKVGGDETTGIWFNEGWTYVNTSHDYPALPLTGRTPADYAHMTVRSIADMTAAGLDKFILFHIGYEAHGKSWWDWTLSGTELWDDHGDPTVAVSVFNVLSYHLGLSHHVATLRPPGAVLHVFHDERHDRGLAVAYATRDRKTLLLPVPGLVIRDVMGNDTKAKTSVDGEQAEVPPGHCIVPLARDRRPYYLIPEPAISGKRLAELLAPLDEAALDRAAGRKVYRLPEQWVGTKVGAADGNPFVAEGEPLWRLDQVWPDDPMRPASYQPLTWSGTQWAATEHSHGGQPKVKPGARTVELSVRTAWPGQPGAKLAALVFIAPQAGTYAVRGTLTPRVWDGGAPIAMDVLTKTGADVTRLARVELKSRADAELTDINADLAAGDELILFPSFPGKGLVAFNCRVEDLRIVLFPASAARGR